MKPLSMIVLNPAGIASVAMAETNRASKAKEICLGYLIARSNTIRRLPIFLSGAGGASCSGEMVLSFIKSA